MRFEVLADDGRAVAVDAVDWMMALVRGVELLGPHNVSGFSCSTDASGVVTVQDHGSGRTWVVRLLDSQIPDDGRSVTPPSAELRVTGGPTPRRLMDPKRRAWASLPPRPLWAPDAAPRVAPSQNPRAEAPPNLAEALFEQALRIRDANELVEACDLTLRSALAFVPAEGGAVLRGGKADQDLEFVAVRGGAGAALIGHRVPWGRGLAGAACLGGVAITASDVRADPRHDPTFDALTGFTTRGLLAVPVRTESGFYGVIEIVNPTGGTFEPWHLDVVESLARALADRLSGRA